MYSGRSDERMIQEKLQKQVGTFYLVIRLINVAMVLAPLWCVWVNYYMPGMPTLQSLPKAVVIWAAGAGIFEVLCDRLDGFVLFNPSAMERVIDQVMAAGATDLAACVMIWILSSPMPSIVPGICCFCVQCAVIFLCVVVSNWVFWVVHKPTDAVIVYDVRQGMEQLISQYGLQDIYHVIGTYTIEEVLRSPELIAPANIVFMSGIHSHDRNVILKHCISNNQKMFVIPRIGDALMSSAGRVHLFHLPMLVVKRCDPVESYRFTKRTFDIILSALALIVLSPIFLVLALLVHSDSGSVIYRQRRLTKDGKEFDILKFRSMRMDAEKMTGAVLSAGENDPRITRVGRILRAYRLDELPQLINILKGDMSFVGPRPERPEIAAQIEKEIPEFRLRLQVKAGLTGYAQVYGKYNTSAYDKLLMDLQYIANPSLMEDLYILLSTVRILFSKESTEGVGEEQTVLTYAERNV